MGKSEAEDGDEAISSQVSASVRDTMQPSEVSKPGEWPRMLPDGRGEGSVAPRTE